MGSVHRGVALCPKPKPSDAAIVENVKNWAARLRVLNTASSRDDDVIFTVGEVREILDECLNGG